MGVLEAGAVEWHVEQVNNRIDEILLITSQEEKRQKAPLINLKYRTYTTLSTVFSLLFFFLYIYKLAQIL